MKGKIISGYPGIGKTTYVKNNIEKAIDLDSSLFHPKTKGWEKYYINVAQALAKQGFIVFISCHAEVRDELALRDIDYTLIYPAKNLYEVWCDKLEDRYNKSGKDTDYRAFKFQQNSYLLIVEDLERYKNSIIINDINYDLSDIINNIERR